MRGLDTNVLVRYLTADEPRQTAAAERIIEECVANKESIYLTAIVLCELVWVLSRLYRQTKSQIVEHLERILATAEFAIEYDSLVRAALRSWRSGTGDFSDHLIGEINHKAGCRDTVTLDRALRNSGRFFVIA